VEDRWYEYFLHNQRARLLEWILLARGYKNIYTVSSPYYLPESARKQRKNEQAEKLKRQ
jgi:hypothetical protein